MSLSRLRLRRLAACVLLGWLLAFGVSVAHACGLVSRVAAVGHAGSAKAAGGAPAHGALAANADEQAPVADSVTCVKFCDEKKTSVSNAGTIAATSPALVNSVPLPVVRPDAPTLSPGTGWMHDQGWRPARSLPIELLRLTL